MITNKISTHEKNGFFNVNHLVNGSFDIYFINSALRLAGIQHNDPSDLESQRITKIIKSKLRMLNGVWLMTNRKYHGISHLNFGIDFLTKPEIQEQLEEKDVAIVSWFYHDLFLGGKDSVFASSCFSDYFLEEISVSTQKRDMAQKNVLATDHSQFAKSNDAKIIADIDLFPLSIPEREFRKNTADLAFECGKEKSTAMFISEVCLFFLMLLERDSVFQTDYFSQFERRARNNMERFLKENLKS